ncbi:DUF418 domain-containing protein [Actinomycetes bacterium KLBMP 9797]
MRSSRQPTARGPVQPGERALAPDLARGVMLLLIVLSNTGFYLWAAEHGASGWHPTDGSTVDQVVQFLMITALDLRTYPLFAFLFGYGMTQLFLRQTAAGAAPKAAVSLLRRRSLWLIVFGFAHAALLMAGDIIGAYGLASLVLGWLFLRRANRTLLVWAAIGVALIALFTVPSVIDATTGHFGHIDASTVEPTTVVYASGEENPLAAAGTRLQTWLFVVFVAGGVAVPIHVAILLGFWAARRRVLEEPHRHLALLRWTAAVGVPIGWLGGLPAALAHVGALDVPAAAVAESGALAEIAAGTGLFGGLGYVALFGLLAHRMSARARRSPAAIAVAAVGKRSLSSYLTHSLIFSPVLAAWGLGLGGKLGSASMAAFAVGVWLVTVAGAYALERAGRRGPAEALLRWLVYRDIPAVKPAAPVG